MSCPTIQNIASTECIGNSLTKINSNFSSLSGGVCDNNSLIAGLAAQISALTSQVQGLASSASSIPVGTVSYYVKATPPTGWLIANGIIIPNGTGTVQGITANFAALYAVIGTVYGAAGTLPDLRGYFIRSSGTNTDGTASTTLGVKQPDALQEHIHNIGPITTTWTGNILTNYTAGSLGGQGFPNKLADKDTGIPITSGTNGAPRTAAETRPKNIALLACIKY